MINLQNAVFIFSTKLFKSKNLKKFPSLLFGILRAEHHTSFSFAYSDACASNVDFFSSSSFFHFFNAEINQSINPINHQSINK